MQATNYLRQIRKVVASYDKDEPSPNLSYARTVLDLANGAELFMLPENGRIMNDELRGIEDFDEIRLPFKKMVVEFRCEEQSCNMALIIIESEEAQAISKGSLKDPLPGFLVCAFAKHDLIGEWTTFLAHAVVVRKNHKDGGGGVKLAMRIVDPITRKDFTPDTHEFHAAKYALINPVLELVEALSCSNVTTEYLPHKHTREKHAALGFDEYRTLVVKTGGKHAAHGKASNGGSSDHYTQRREHLRRGHIRRHPTAGNIWINSMVVNAGVGAKVHKTYKVEAA